MSTGCAIYVEFQHGINSEQALDLKSRPERLTTMTRPNPASKLEIQAIDDPICLMEGFSGYSVDDEGHLRDQNGRRASPSLQP